MINFNGQLIDADSAILRIDNRGYCYGDGLFETIKVENGNIKYWEDHYFRLMASMRIMRMEIPMNFTMEFLEQEILKTLESNDLLSVKARVRFTVDRGNGGFYKPINKSINYSIVSTELKPIEKTLFTDRTYVVDIFKDHYINPGLLSTLKSNNKAINVLGSIYAEDNDLHNCILLNGNKSVVEALNSNLFLVMGNVIKTPPLSDGCLNGIMRKQLIILLKKNKEFSLIEESISPFELQKADEIFLTNTIWGIKPISNYRKKKFRNEVSEQLNNLLGNN